jgi:hypothetical protein
VVASPRLSPPATPDGRYIVVRGRLWRRANPHLPESARLALVTALMAARRAVKRALQGSAEALAEARGQVEAAGVDLGERGPVWWYDGSPDHSGHLVRNTPYAEWYASLDEAPRVAPPPDTASSCDDA